MRLRQTEIFHAVYANGTISAAARALNGRPAGGTIDRTPPMRSAIVVGAGVVGMATAYALARRGVAVTIIDREPLPGNGASFANGAQLSYVYTDALASPALLRHAPALLLGMDPAFRFAPSLDMDHVSWLLAFLRNASASRYTANTLAGLALGLESRAAMQALLERHPIRFHHRQSGKIHVHDSAASFAAARHMVDLKRQHGAVQEVLSEAEARRIEPALTDRPGPIAGAILSPQEQVGDPHAFCAAMAELLVRDYGATLRLATTVAAINADARAIITTDSDERLEADHLVMCGGIAARNLLRPLGVRTRLMAMKGYSFDAAPGSAAPLHSITDVSRKLVFCQLGERIRIAGLAELGRCDTHILPGTIAKLKASAEAALPDAADYRDSSEGWAGIRPMSPSSLPDIRHISPTLSINVGHGMLGWTFAMGSAEHIAETLLPGVLSP